MIQFIKNLLGFGAPQETIKEILTPPAKSDPIATAVTAATYIEPAKPINKVRAITDTNPNAVKAAQTPKPANKKRRPYRGNKVKAGGTVAKTNQPKPAITEGAIKGGNGSVKPAQVAKSKPAKPKAPVAKK